MKYNVQYYQRGQRYLYQAKWSDLETAKKSLAMLLDKYGDVAEGTQKPYPNGKGEYAVESPWIINEG